MQRVAVLLVEPCALAFDVGACIDDGLVVLFSRGDHFVRPQQSEGQKRALCRLECVGKVHSVLQIRQPVVARLVAVEWI